MNRGLSPEREAFAAAVRTYCRREFSTVAQQDAVIDGGTAVGSVDEFIFLGESAQGIDGNLARESAMAKTRSTTIAKNITLEAMQIMGGYGFAREYGMEGRDRRALAPLIGGGTNEIQCEIIADSLAL